MQVFINEQATDTNGWNFLRDVMVSKGIEDAKGYAVAVNNNVIPRNEWSNKRLGEGDKILIIKASAGG
ncbi:MAG: sulfur carrier protein ThiS [Flavobacteriales bacterium]|nr:sulfur carrier protein ThiS [Flavobacteriales bacterium]